jgi:hypothetical protein
MRYGSEFTFNAMLAWCKDNEPKRRHYKRHSDADLDP